MRIITTKRLDDGKGFNTGQISQLIQIEDPRDYDQIEANILATNYYGSRYFQERIGHQAETVKPANLLVAAMLKHLDPRAVLELGCGRGDILFLLALAGARRVRGIDLSQDAVASVFPLLAGKVDCGDLLAFCPVYARQGQSFDTVVAMDIWEHLHPARLPDYIRAAVEVSSDDALFFSILPAFGQDRVFGEIFPLEFEENRTSFERQEPFSYLSVDVVEPPIPVNGHLIWAPSEWWEAQFVQQGLVRVAELEANLHQCFDDHLFYAQKAFYVFRRDTPAAAARAARLLAQPLDQLGKAALLTDLYLALRKFARAQGKEVFAPLKTLLDLNHTLGLIEGRHHDKARLLARLCRDLRGDLELNREEVSGLLAEQLAWNTHQSEQDLFAWVEGRVRALAGQGAAARWLTKALLGLARRGFVQYRRHYLQ